MSTIELWGDYAPPKRPDQWKDGRSAKESARAWIASQPLIPSEILDCLESHRDFRHLKEWRAEPEAQVSFDSFGGPPNLDVLLRGVDSYGLMIIAIEAKADEPFADTVGRTLSKARKRLENNTRSGGIDRIRNLVEGILGGSVNQHLDVRYQLLTASAAAIAEAKRQGADRAVLLVHELRTNLTKDKKLKANASDLLNFFRLVSGEATSDFRIGVLYGPFIVPMAMTESDHIGLYLGKVVRDLRRKEQKVTPIRR